MRWIKGSLGRSLERSSSSSSASVLATPTNSLPIRATHLPRTDSGGLRSQAASSLRSRPLAGFRLAVRSLSARCSRPISGCSGKRDAASLASLCAVRKRLSERCARISSIQDNPRAWAEDDYHPGRKDRRWLVRRARGGDRGEVLLLEGHPYVGGLAGIGWRDSG